MPTSLAGLHLFARPGHRVFSHCALRPGSRLGEEFLEADIRLLDQSGHLVGELTGLKVRRLGGEAEPEVREDAKDLMYEVAWVTKPASSQPREFESPETGSWLFLGDQTGLGAALAKLLESRGGTCNLFPPATLRVRQESAYRGVIYLSGLDIRPLDNAPNSLAEAQKVWLAAFHLVQTVAKLPSHMRPRLWMVTRGAQAAWLALWYCVASGCAAVGLRKVG